MDKLEKVEKIIEKTGVSYEDAKNALDQCNDDILDAICLLEKEGKIKNSYTASYTSFSSSNETDEKFAKAQANYEESVKEEKFSDILSSFFNWTKKIVDKSFKICLLVKRHGAELAKIPLFFFLVLMILGFWFFVPVLIIGLFFECRYSFVGLNSEKVDINDVCDKMADGVDDFKKNINK